MIAASQGAHGTQGASPRHARRGRCTLTIAFPPGENRSDHAALAAQIRDTIAWPIGLLL